MTVMNDAAPLLPPSPARGVGLGPGDAAARIDALLPQTQCRKCGFAACLPYAEAIVAGAAEINRCPPGGERVIRRLAELLGRDFKPLDPACGTESPRAVAVIDEDYCIGCTLCIQACPVDAIVGAAKQMHTVVVPLCTGCELCLAPCPVDCIAMQPVDTSAGHEGYSAQDADAARGRFRQRLLRLARDEREKQQAARLRRPAADRQTGLDAELKKALVAAAIERAKARAERRANPAASKPSA